MTRISSLSMALVAVGSMMVGGCGATDIASQEKALTLDEAGAAWNDRHSFATYLEARDLYTITTEEERMAAVQLVANDNHAPDFGAGMLALIAGNVDSETLEQWAALVDANIAIGDSLVAVDYEMENDQLVTAFAVNDENGDLKLDSVLVGDLVAQNLYTSTHSKTALWIWGGERGRLTVTITAHGPWAPPSSCSVDECSCSMMLGSCEVRCSPPIVRGACCVTTVDFAFKTPVAKAKYKGKGLGFEVSGLGSVYHGTFEAVDCLPWPTSPPVEPEEPHGHR